MVSYQVIVFVAYLGILQCDLYQTAYINGRPPTNSQIGIPLRFMDSLLLPCLGQKGMMCKSPNAVILSVPSSATKSGRTSIVISTGKFPIPDGGGFYRPSVNGKTNVDVVVELDKGNKMNDGQSTSSSSTSAVESSANRDQNGDQLKSSSKSNTTVDSDGEQVNVLVKFNNQQDISNGNQNEETLYYDESLIPAEPDAGAEAGDDSPTVGPSTVNDAPTAKSDTGNNDSPVNPGAGTNGPAAEPAPGPATGDNRAAVESDAAAATGAGGAAAKSSATAAGENDATAESDASAS